MENLPDDIQWYIWKIFFSKYVISHLKYKDWWFHNVKNRSNISIKSYLDAEIFSFQSQKHFFSYNYI